MTLELTGGALATVACAYALPRGPDQVAIAIAGTKGWVRWDGSDQGTRAGSDGPSSTVSTR